MGCGYVSKFPCEGEQCLFCSCKTPTGCSFYGANDAGNAIEDDSRDIIFALIRDNPEITSKDLIDITGYTRPRVFRATNFLISIKAIKKQWDSEGFIFEVIE